MAFVEAIFISFVSLLSFPLKTGFADREDLKNADEFMNYPMTKTTRNSGRREK